MSSVGTPALGEKPGFDVNKTISPIIKRYSVICLDALLHQIHMPRPGTIGDGDRVFGVAFNEFPHLAPTANIDQNATVLEDRSPGVWDTSVQNRLTTQVEGVSWVRVIVPEAGTDLTFEIGNFLIPSTDTTTGSTTGLTADGGAIPYAPLAYNTTFDEVEFIAEALVRNRIFGKCLSRLHIPVAQTGFEPSLGTDETATATATDAAAADVVGFVLAKLFLR